MVGLFCESSQRVKAVGCFRRTDPSLIFNGMLNVTLSEEKVSTIDVGNSGLPLPPTSLDSHQTQIQQDDILD